MEAIREQYGLTALRLGYTQGDRGDSGPQEVTCSVRSPDGQDDDWRVPAEGIPLLARARVDFVDSGVEEGLADCAAWLRRSSAVEALQVGHGALWLAVSGEHPLLPAWPGNVAWNPSACRSCACRVS